MESDCLTLVSAVHNSIPYGLSVGLVIQDCKDHLGKLLDYHFVFARMSMN